MTVKLYIMYISYARHVHEIQNQILVNKTILCAFSSNYILNIAIKYIIIHINIEKYIAFIDLLQHIVVLY